MVSALVLVPADAAAIGCVKRFDAQCDFVLFHGAAIAAFESRRIRFTSPHDYGHRLATGTGQDSKHGMLHHPRAADGDPVPQILRQWLQAWRTCFTAPSWEHVLVLVMGALLAPG